MGTRIALVLGVVILMVALLLDLGYPSNDTEVSRSSVDALAAAITRNRDVSAHRAAKPTESNLTDVAVQVDLKAASKRVEFKRFTKSADVTTIAESTIEHDWLARADAVELILTAVEETGRGWAFGWVQLKPGFDRPGLSELWEESNVQAIGMSGEFARLRLPGSRSALETLIDHPDIVGVGMQPPEEKISSRFESMERSLASELPVLITLMEADTNGTWRSNLESNGVVVGEWLPYARAYSANVQVDAISTLASFDYVASIEPVEVFQVLLDTAVPVMGVDGVRTYNETTGTFTGVTGESIPVGVIDTGLNLSHTDIATNRTSVCGGNFYPDDGGDGDFDLWSDYSGHGTHVTGIIAGNGSGRAQFAGMAPSVPHIRFAKVLNRDGSGDSVTVANGVRYLLGETACEWEGTQSEAVKPMILNMSLGGPGERDGRGASNRNIDAVISLGTQLLVIAAGNDGTQGTSNEATSKNALAVGSVTDAGVVNNFSSHGPTSDGRLNPHVVGTGSAVVSAKGNSSTSSYVQYNGTSMAAPSVSGVAALLMDENEAFRNAPAYVKARLMSSAVKPSQTLGLEDFPLTNSDGPGTFNDEYGLGLVAASVAIQDNSDGHWSHGGDHGTVEPGEVYEYQIEVPEGSARIDIVLTWIESPNEAIASVPVAANLDLYLDKDGDCGAATCGEFASTSEIDNVEWIIVKDPEPGSYTLRFVAINDFVGSVQTGISWTTIADRDSPTLSISAPEQSLEIESGHSFEVALDVSVDGFLSSGTTVHVVCRSESETGCDGYEDNHWLPSSHVNRSDGTKILVDSPIEVAVPIGEVRFGVTRSLTLVVPRDVATESHTLFFIASSWNARSALVSLDIKPDGSQGNIQAVQPENDAIANAVMLGGESGETTLDLLLTTREPGEPIFSTERGGSGVKKFFSDTRLNQHSYDAEMQSYSRHGSVWFLIEPERSGPYRIQLEPERTREGTRLGVYEGPRPLDSSRIAVNEGGVEFRAESDTRYFLQVWTAAMIRAPMRLTWNQFDQRRPANDDFENRTTLTGNEGVVAGTNYRATLQSFEFYGIESIGASTWFRWVAPESQRYEFAVSGGLRSFVFDGTNTTALRRVSTMPSRGLDSQFVAVQDREYQIVILDNEDRLIPDYQLSWQPVETPSSRYAENDLIRDATVIEGTTGEESIDTFDARTVEPNEDARTGVGTGWWQWDPPSLDDYVFRLNGSGVGQLTVFSGTSLDDVEFVAGGDTLRISTLENLQYWIAVGYRPDSMFADVDGFILQRSFSWGPLPGNDLFSSPTSLAGATGTVTADHSFATSSIQEFGDIRGHSSLWWHWEAPSTGWQRFELQDWETAGLDAQSQQAIIAVYHQQSGHSPVLIATSDHSLIANGQAEATIRAEEGEMYLIRVALRSTQLHDWKPELTFSYEPVETPVWQRYAGRIVEVAGLDDEFEDQSLFEPWSASIVNRSGHIGIATGDGVVVYTEGSDGELTQSATAPYMNATGESIEISEDAVLQWDTNADRLYLLQESGIFQISTPLSNSSRIALCTTRNLGILPEQARFDDESSNMYVLGEDEINVYAIRAACQLDLVQTVSTGVVANSSIPHLRVHELLGVNAIELNPSDERIYAAGNESLITFGRADNGSLTLESTYNVADWAMDAAAAFTRASVVLGHADTLFVVADLSPVVAAFRISDQGEGQTPEFLDVLDTFYLSQESFLSVPFYSHVAWPQRREGCTAITSYGEVSPAVDVFCDNQVFTVALETDGDTLSITDWFHLEQTDRFGRFLRDGVRTLSPQRIVENAQGNRNYLLGDGTVGNLHIFDRASRITDNPYTQ